MQEPTIYSNINGYTFQWEDLSLFTRVNRIVIHSDGRIIGELQMTNNRKDDPLVILPPSQVNFTSEQTRNKLAKQLANKYPETDFDWTDLFDYLGQKVQELARAGDQTHAVQAQNDIEAPEPFIDPIIYPGVANIIFGAKGVAKSTFSYLLAAYLTLPRDTGNPLDLKMTEFEDIRVLVLDWETNEDAFRYYLSRIKKGMDLPPFTIYYRRCHLPLSEDLTTVAEHIEKAGADILIIDSLAAAAGGEQGELKGSQAALQFNMALRKLNRTSVILAQTQKAEDQTKSIYGSGLFTYYGRNILELCRGEESYEDTVHLGLFHRDCNLGKKHSPIGLALSYHEDGGIEFEREPLSVDEFMSKVNTQTKVLNTLKRGAMTVKEIADVTDLGESTVRMAISRLNKNKKITKVGNKWGLSDNGDH